MKIKYQALLLPALVALASCSGDDMVSPNDKMGSVSLVGVEVSNASEVINSQSAPGSRAVTDVSSYIVEFYRQGEADAFRTYVYADMPGTVELPEGVYHASVRSHDLLKAEYERPYFSGQSENFTITAGKITEVAPVKCTFRSLKVSIVFGEKLKSAMASDVKVTVVANDEGRLEFTPERSSGYFATIDGSATLVATFTGTVNGNYENFFTTYTDVAAGQHRIITYEVEDKLPMPDVPGGKIDGSGVKIDVTCEDVDLNADVDPGKEDTLSGDDEPGKLPNIGGGDEPDDDPITFGGTLENGRSYTSTELSTYAVTINAPKGCKDVKVKIDSTSLTPDELENVGLASEFSLVNDSQYFEGLNDLGLPHADGVLNQQTVNFDITGFMSLLAILGPSTSEFTLEVTDNDGNVATIKFTIVVE